MKNIYKSIKDGKPAKRLGRITIIIIMAMVWILIDKGNIYGQSLDHRSVISKSSIESETQSALLREGDDVRGDEIPTGDEGDYFTLKPNPVEHDLVFDFEFTVKEGIPVQVLDPLGRLAYTGVFQPGISTQTLDFSGFKTGMYIVRLDFGDKIEVRRIIKR